jgi:hypothetical protein
MKLLTSYTFCISMYLRISLYSLFFTFLSPIQILQDPQEMLLLYFAFILKKII